MQLGYPSVYVYVRWVDKIGGIPSDPLVVAGSAMVQGVEWDWVQIEGITATGGNVRYRNGRLSSDTDKGQTEVLSFYASYSHTLGLSAVAAPLSSVHNMVSTYDRQTR